MSKTIKCKDRNEDLEEESKQKYEIMNVGGDVAILICGIGLPWTYLNRHRLYMICSSVLLIGYIIFVIYFQKKTMTKKNIFLYKGIFCLLCSLMFYLTGITTLFITEGIDITTQILILGSSIVVQVFIYIIILNKSRENTEKKRYGWVFIPVIWVVFGRSLAKTYIIGKEQIIVLLAIACCYIACALICSIGIPKNFKKYFEENKSLKQ